MKPVFDFIVEPVGERYNNEVEVGNKKLILNKDFIPFGPADDPIAKRKAIDMSRNFGHEANWWRQNPNVKWWANGVASDR